LSQSTLTKEQMVRQDIERCRRELAADPKDAKANNELAWIYLTGSAMVRDEKAALPLAERAVQFGDGNANYRNTLALAYYRAGRYREAVELLLQNLAKQKNELLAFDLFFLAMSHCRLGETEQARNYLALAIRWTTAQRNMGPEHMEELKAFRMEAEELIGIEKK
jgi:TPR repeat protein